MRVFLSGALAACSIYGQAGTGINEIREAALTSLFAQPNYTCLETIDRGHEERGSLELEDRVRVEVVIVDGKEMFSWPGDSNFENAEILNLVRNGLFNSGNFGLYPRMLFFGTSAVFTFRGAAKIGDRSVVRHDFVVPQEASGFHVQHRDSDAAVGFHGSIFTDPATLELVRLTAIADAIPPEIGITGAQDQVDYGRVSFGDHTFLLPLASDSQIARPDGIDRNRVEFSKCHRFSGESRIIFGDADLDSGGAIPSRREVTLAAGTEISLAFTDINLETGAIGDRVKATVLTDVKRGKEILVPKGATAFGRITKLSRYKKHYRLEVRLQDLEWPAGVAPLKAQLKSSKSAKAEMDDSGDLILHRPTLTLTDLPLVWKVVP